MKSCFAEPDESDGSTLSHDSPEWGSLSAARRLSGGAPLAKRRRAGLARPPNLVRKRPLFPLQPAAFGLHVHQRVILQRAEHVDALVRQRIDSRHLLRG